MQKKKKKKKKTALCGLCHFWPTVSSLLHMYEGRDGAEHNQWACHCGSLPQKTTDTSLSRWRESTHPERGQLDIVQSHLQHVFHVLVSQNASCVSILFVWQTSFRWRLNWGKLQRLIKREKIPEEVALTWVQSHKGTQLLLVSASNQY